MEPGVGWGQRPRHQRRGSGGDRHHRGGRDRPRARGVLEGEGKSPDLGGREEAETREREEAGAETQPGPHPKRASGASGVSWLGGRDTVVCRVLAGRCTTQSGSWKLPWSALPQCLPLLSSQPLPGPEWQRRLWPLPVPRAGGQWSILVCSVAREPGEGQRGRAWYISWRLDGEQTRSGVRGLGDKVWLPWVARTFSTPFSTHQISVSLQLGRSVCLGRPTGLWGLGAGAMESHSS